MIEKGKIVYHDQVIFGDNQIDNKKKRPCIVLFVIEYENKRYICTCPLTSQVKTFNKCPKNYKFIPEQVYEYKKLNFAKLNSVRLYLEEETHETPYSIDVKYVDSIIDGVLNIKTDGSQKRIYDIQQILQYEKLFEKFEEKEKNRQKKLCKIQKRREWKGDSR